MNLLTPWQQRCERLLRDYWQQRPIEPALKAAMIYATTNGGKRFRPALTWLVGEALGLPQEQLDPAALAIELVHCYSLVHDDLPAMDDDDLRRGQPTVHIKFDEATAILAGDALLTEAMELLSHAELPADIRLRQLQLLSHAAGSQGMVAGQMMDMAATGQSMTLDALILLHELKTGALIRAALLLGAAPSQDYPSLEKPLGRLGLTLGLAFQVQDDILEAEGAQTGKSADSDARNGKNTFPALLGLDAARDYRDELIQQCHLLLNELPLRSPALRQVIDFVAERRH
ncbi:polyprenyl synthetase family protein [Sulfurivirga sp.]|uniref:polyprenyl synthetase family protein n=1 Tax=Sulfurivirga sp. TaxID=2614236 RepID=UPI0025D2413C|nr:farnesyl diphosphate synthase [Sulfurivirga sp.]